MNLQVAALGCGPRSLAGFVPHWLTVNDGQSKLV